MAKSQVVSVIRVACPGCGTGLLVSPRWYHSANLQCGDCKHKFIIHAKTGYLVRNMVRKP
jgi:ribosomal protein S27E